MCDCCFSEQIALNLHYITVGTQYSFVCTHPLPGTHPCRPRCHCRVKAGVKPLCTCTTLNVCRGERSRCILAEPGATYETREQILSNHLLLFLAQLLKPVWAHLFTRWCSVDPLRASVQNTMSCAPTALRIALEPPMTRNIREVHGAISKGFPLREPRR